MIMQVNCHGKLITTLPYFLHLNSLRYIKTSYLSVSSKKFANVL